MLRLDDGSDDRDSSLDPMAGSSSMTPSPSSRGGRPAYATGHLSQIPLFVAFWSLAACGGSNGSAPDATRSAAPPPAASIPAANSAALLGGCSPAGPGEQLRTSDVNGDGIPEVCKYYRSVDDPERPGQRRSVLFRQDLDVNWDGKVDIKRLFEADGKVSREEWDADYDGRVDKVSVYDEGKIVRSERDLDNDGRMEVMRFYANGKLDRKETDSNGDGRTDRWEYYNGRVVDRVGVDKDGDGKVDSWAKASSTN